jgi:glycosyltransferase involved in cell wall biosynthesis
MPAYNRATFIAEAIESILSQTFDDLELIVVDDGSRDETVEVIKGFDDSRLKLIELGTNHGLAAARNAGMDAARGRYLAVMDSDDIALPHRLATQVAYLEAHPDIDLCGMTARMFGDRQEYWRCFENSALCHGKLLWVIPFLHSTWMMRRLVIGAQRYDETLPVASDYEFLVSLSRRVRINGINRIGVMYRIHSGGISNLRRHDLIDAWSRAWRVLFMEMGLTQFSMEQLALHGMLWGKEYLPQPLTMNFLCQAEQWLRCIELANERTARLDPFGVRQILRRNWWHLCKVAAAKNADVWRRYIASPFARRGLMTPAFAAKMAYHCLR